MKNSADTGMPHGVSVVIPTINRATVLLDTVRDILVQEFDEYEIIIVDQSEEINDAVLQLIGGSTVSARYFKANFRGLPQARNFGWRAARKDIVLYIDDDIRCDAHLVRRHYEAHVRTDAALVAGGITEARGNKDSPGDVGSFNWWTATSVRNFHFQIPKWCLHAPGGNFSVRREALKTVTGLDEHLTVGAALYEETELALRLRQAGYKAWFEPSAHLLHLAAPAGGCRVPDNWPRYMHGLAHNRAILIFRHLRWWHRPSALARLLLLGMSYSRLDKSLAPLASTLKGITAGRVAATKHPLNQSLDATECTSS